MGHKVFIPRTDELIFDRPELISSPLRPYIENIACYHWLDIRLNPQDDIKIAESFNRLRTQSSIQEVEYPETVAA
jgi:hypothetical protein